MRKEKVAEGEEEESGNLSGLGNGRAGTKVVTNAVRTVDGISFHSLLFSLFDQ